MRTYTVRDISKMLGKNPETVRRWIRGGKLKANQASRKGGNYVTEAELKRFLKRTPKYAAVAGGIAAALPGAGIPIAIGGLVGGILGFIGADINAKDGQIDPADVIRAVEKNIDKLNESIKHKRETIAQLEEEILADEQQIEALQITLDQVKNRLVEEKE